MLDTNTISYYFRGEPQVVQRLQAQRPAEIGVPAIVVYELRYGLARLPTEAAAPRTAALDAFAAHGVVAVHECAGPDIGGVDDWVLHTMESPSATGARGLVRGQFFSHDGRLIASTVQEGLMRHRKGDQ